MSLIKTAMVLAVVVAFMPTDERRQAELATAAGTALNNALTYCERNPQPCAKAGEAWANFKLKAEFGFDLASRMVREAMASRQTAKSYDAEPVQPAPARFEPDPRRGTLTPADRVSDWRAPGRTY